MLKSPSHPQENKILQIALTRELLILVLVTEVDLQVADPPVQESASSEEVFVEAETLLALVTDFRIPVQRGDRAPVIGEHEIVKGRVFLRQRGQAADRGGGIVIP